jgi:nucleotide-binding universal stress UspA family protein
MTGISPSAPATFGRVVVGVDDTQAGLAALGWAIGQATRTQAELVAVRAWEPGLPRHGGRRRHQALRPRPQIVPGFDGTEERAAAAELAHRSLRIATAGGPREGTTVTVVTPEGEPAAVLPAIASQPGDVLVLGHDPGHSLKRAVHRSVSRYCRTHARCPVYIVPAHKGARLG